MDRPPAVLAPPGDTVAVSAGAEYHIGGPLGWLDRWLFGKRYRQLWTDSVRVPVLDLRAIDGGLRPRGADSLNGSTQLLLTNADRADYTFRLANPQLAPILPADLRTDAVVGPLQDLVSALHPGAPYVTAPLARAAGIHQAAPVLAVIPFDTVLGSYRVDFGGQLGYLRREPFAREAGSSVSTDTLIAHLAAGDATPVDERAFLLSRLFDVYVGHSHFAPGEQRWRPVGTPPRWEPVAMGHDLAFARFDGLVARLARVEVPMFTVFGGKYPSGLGETEYQLAFDRRFLGAMEWAAWDSVAREIQGRLTDSLIALAVAALPSPWDEQTGTQLARALKSRRDRLPEAARSLYLLLNEEPDIYAASGDTVLVNRVEDGAVDITIAPSFHRRFIAEETKQVRLFLEGDGSVVLVRGGTYGGPPVRVVTGSGRATILDSTTAATGAITVNDSAGHATIVDPVEGAAPSVTRKPFPRPTFVPAAGASLVKPAEGVRWGPVTWFDLFGSIGLLVGGGVERIGYDAGYVPYRSLQWIRAGYATQPDEYAVQYHGEYRFKDRSLRFFLDAERSGIELLKFYGYGNETADTGNQQYYDTKQVLYKISPALVWHLRRSDSLAAGLVYKDVTTDSSANTLLNAARPFGWPQYDELGVNMAYAHDTRDSPVAPRSGMLLLAAGKFFPPLLDVHTSFGGISGAVSTYWTPDDEQRLTFALRAGGEKIWGPFPTFEAAFIGGESTILGLRPQRYAGDASLFGNIETRWRLAQLPFVLRWDLGVSGIVDVGRVFLDGESSGVWHAGFGGGIWALLPGRSLGGMITVMSTEGTLAIYVGTRFSY